MSNCRKQLNKKAPIKSCGNDKDKAKRDALKAYIETVPYIERSLQPIICKRFNLSFDSSAFAKVYKARFIKFLSNKILCISEVSKQLGMPEKWLTYVKRQLQKSGVLIIAEMKETPTTGNRLIQFVTTDKELIAKHNERANGCE